MPYSYISAASFTNRKYRNRNLTIVIHADAEFFMQGLQIVAPIAMQIGIEIEILAPASHRGVMLPFSFFEAHALVQPVIPGIRLPAGSVMELRMSLPEGFNIGNKRPKVRVILRGCKLFDVPDTITSELSAGTCGD